MKPTIIGLNLRHFVHKHFSEAVIENYYESVISWCHWIKATYDSRLIFFPFNVEKHQSDIPAYDKLVSNLAPHSIHIDMYRYRNFGDLRSNISQCDLFFGTRFHSALLAVQHGVPVLAISYGDKILKFMKDIGFQEYVIRVEEMTPDLLKDKWQRLHEQRDALQKAFLVVAAQQAKLSLGHFDLVANIIENMGNEKS